MNLEKHMLEIEEHAGHLRAKVLYARRLLRAVEEFAQQWEAGKSNGNSNRSVKIWFQTLFGDFKMHVCLGTEDKLADFYCAMDETAWQYAGLEWRSPDSLENEFLDFKLIDSSQPTGTEVEITLFLNDSNNCRLEVVKEIPRASTWISKKYRVVCS